IETVAVFIVGWFTTALSACDDTAARAIGVERFWAAGGGEDSGTPITTPIGFVSRARDIILPIGSGNKTAAITAAASNSAATGNAIRRNRLGGVSVRGGIVVLYGMPYLSASARRRSIFSRHSRIISARTTKSLGR